MTPVGLVQKRPIRKLLYKTNCTSDNIGNTAKGFFINVQNLQFEIFKAVYLEQLEGLPALWFYLLCKWEPAGAKGIKLYCVASLLRLTRFYAKLKG